MPFELAADVRDQSVIGDVHLGHERALPGVDHYQPFGFEPFDRIAQRCPPPLELAGQPFLVDRLSRRDPGLAVVLLRDLHMRRTHTQPAACAGGKVYPPSRPPTVLVAPPTMPWTGFVVVVVVGVGVGVLGEELEPDDPDPDVPGRTLPNPIDCVSPLTPEVTPPTVPVTPVGDVTSVGTPNT